MGDRQDYQTEYAELRNFYIRQQVTKLARDNGYLPATDDNNHRELVADPEGDQLLKELREARRRALEQEAEHDAALDAPAARALEDAADGDRQEVLGNDRDDDDQPPTQRRRPDHAPPDSPRSQGRVHTIGDGDEESGGEGGHGDEEARSEGERDRDGDGGPDRDEEDDRDGDDDRGPDLGGGREHYRATASPGAR